jgi:hypothetical protein
MAISRNAKKIDAQTRSASAAQTQLYFDRTTRMIAWKWQRASSGSDERAASTDGDGY